MSGISGISSIPAVGGANGASPANAPKVADSKNSFGDLVKNFVEQASQDQASADSAMNDLISGKTDNIQQVVMAVANAEMSMQLFMEIRNHLVESYNELMRMQF